MKRSKHLLLIVFISQLLLFANMPAFAQKLKTEQVPEDVRQSLEFEHPSAKVSGWAFEENAFVASFKEEGATGKAYFTNEGTWQKTTFAIPKTELPPVLRDYVKNHYPLSDIVVSVLQSTPEERMHYYIEVKPETYGRSNSILTFNDIGELLSRVDPEGFEEPEVKPGKTVEAKEPAVKKTPKVKESGKTIPNNIPEESVPDIVKKELAKKIQRPEELKWLMIDTFYVADCKYRDQKNEVFISTTGKWEKTYTQLPESAVSGNIAKHLNSFYDGWRFKQAIKETRADRNDKTMIDIYEKKNWKEKLITSVIFDKTGKLIRSIDPTQMQDNDDEGEEDSDLDKYYRKMSMSVEKDPNKGIPTEIVNAFKAKYPRITNPEWKNDDEDNYLATFMGVKGKEIAVIGPSATLIQTWTIGKMEQLPSAIQSYVKKEHKGFKVDEYYSVREIMEKKNYYRVIISNKKTKEEDSLWFSTSGKIVEK